MASHVETVRLIEERLRAQLQPTVLEVIDDSAHHAGHAGALARPAAGHFRVVIDSPLFTGKSTIQKHRLVYDALGDLMHARIHALAIQIGVR